MSRFIDPERERRRKRAVQAKRRQEKPWVQWYRLPAWRRARAHYLAAHEACARCGEPSEVVDHVQPHGGNWELFWDTTNWRALCRPCHDRKTARQDGGFGNAPGLAYDDGCDQNGLPLGGGHPWGAGGRGQGGE